MRVLVLAALVIAVAPAAARPPDAFGRGIVPVELPLDGDTAVPTPLPRRVAHRAVRPFSQVEVRRADGDGETRLAFAVKRGATWWQAPIPLAIAVSDGHTCHADRSKVGAIKLFSTTLAGGDVVAVAQIDVAWTTYMTCPLTPGGPDVRVDGFRERHFLVCGLGPDAAGMPRCLPPIVARTDDRCRTPATIDGGLIDAPCGLSQLDEQGASHPVTGTPAAIVL